MHDAGVIAPACVYPPTGLSEFIAAQHWRSNPEPGDIVFYNFSLKTGDDFSMPHIGIVINIDAWKTDGRFVAVEGDVDGQVVRTLRRADETIGFGRAVVKARLAIGPFMQTGTFFNARLANGQANMQTGPIFDASRIRPGARGRDIMNVQLALNKIVGLSGETPGLFDEPTRLAFARWQRLIGHVGRDVDGIPSPRTLAQLGERSGLWEN